MYIMSTDLSDCTKKGDDGEAWYQYDASGTKTNFLDRVGFVTECIDRYTGDYKVCRDLRFERVGYLTSPDDLHYFQKEGWNFDDVDMGKKCIGSGTPIVGPSACGEVFGDTYHMVCAKKADKFEMNDSKDGWITCCNRDKSKKYSPKGGCHPDFYEGSEECQKVCMGTSTIVKHKLPRHYLSNSDITGVQLSKNNSTYKKDVCNRALKNYKNKKSELLEFCKKSPAYDVNNNNISKRPNPFYKNICGCHYPDEYYTKQLDKLKILHPTILRAQWGTRECFSDLCTYSDIKYTGSFRDSSQSGKCPNNNLQSCIMKAGLEANTIEVKDDAQLNVNRVINCIQNVDGSTTTNTNNEVTNNEVTLKSTKNKVKTLVSENKVLVIIFLVVLIIVVGLIIYLSIKS